MFVPRVDEILQRNNFNVKTASHISIRIIEEAISNIQLIKFSNHFTNRIQPLDNGPVKTVWERILVDHEKTEMRNNATPLTKNEFANLLEKV